MLNRILFLCWGLIICWGGAQAQNLLRSPQQATEGQVFRLDPQEAKSIMERGIPYKWLPERDVYARFPSADGGPMGLPPGHYITAVVDHNLVRFTYLQETNCEVFVENDQQHLMLKLMDRQGQVIPDALVKIGTAILPFDPLTQTYKTSHRRQGGMVEIETDGNVQFYNLAWGRRHADTDYDYDRPNQLYRRWVRRPFMNWVIKPVALTVRLPYDLVQSVIKRKLYGWPGLIGYRMRQLMQLGRKATGGAYPVKFMVCSQPRYRPGDTVRVKAYVTQATGERIRAKLGLYLTDKSGHERLATAMQKMGPNSYAGSFALTDSLNLALDRDVPLRLGRLKGTQKNDKLAQVSFRYEDYELNQFKFAMRAASPSHWQGKVQTLYLQATDFNGLTVPDARAQITLRSKWVERWEDDRAFLPDVLWTWSGNLDAAGETRIDLPATAFNDAVFGYEVVADCWSSDNEHKTQTLSLNYLHDKGELVSKQEGHWLSVDYLFHGASIPKTAVMEIRRGGNANPEKRELQLPAKLLLSPAWAGINFFAGDLRHSWASPSGIADLSVEGTHSGDSLELHAHSISGLTFAWHLFAGNREVLTGNGATLDYKQKTHRNEVYTLNVHGTGGGSPFSEDYTFFCPKNRLNVEWSGPSTIYPGMTAEITVQVHDYRGHAVKKADLTAYAVNGRFEGEGAPKLSMRPKKEKKRRRPGDYALKRSTPFAQQRNLKYAQWVQTTGIDTLPWYQFSYPDSQLYVYQHPIEPGRTEIAPFVVKDGEIQPVQVVYIDGSPVYFAWSQPAAPYSFEISPGQKHMIEIRLPHQVIRLDTVVVVPGYKTILSVDLDHLSTRVKTWPMKTTINPQEKAVVNRYTLGYRDNNLGGSQIISFGNRIFKLQTGSTFLCGPAIDGEVVFEKIDAFSHAIAYEPHFQYEFGPKTVKMREMQPNAYPENMNYRATVRLEDRAWLRDSLVAQWRRSLIKSKSRPALRWSQFPSGDYGRILLAHDSLPGKNNRLAGVVFYDAARALAYVLRPDLVNEMRAPLGKWSAFLMLENEEYVQLDSVEIRGGGRNFMRMHYRADEIQDSLPALIAKLIASNPSPEAYQSPSTYNPQRNLNRYTSGRTARISGQVLDASTGDPMALALIYCEGYPNGTYTDLEGQFEMDIPVETDSIMVRYLGYETKVIRWDGLPMLKIDLAERSIEMQEILIETASRSMQMSASVDVISATSGSAMMGFKSDLKPVTLGALEIRGARAGEVSYYIDGKLKEDPSAPNKAPDFPAELMAGLEGQSTLRKDFRDNAIWRPDLLTDHSGKSSFQTTFPDDITRWDAYAVAIDRHGRAGATTAFINSWKPLAGRLAMPRFLMAGDTCLAIGKVLNYTGDTLQVRRRFLVDGRTQEHVGACGPVQLDTLAFTPSPSADSLRLSYMAERADGYGDGEELGVKVFPVGIEDARGTFASLVSDTTLKVAPFQADGGPVHVYATTKMQELLLTETRRLHDYSHLCNEQLSSKLIALLAEQQIFKSLDRPWHGQKDVQKCVQMLDKRISLDQGLGWGWWPGMKPEIWVSLHVTKALLMARAQGYEVRTQMLDWIPGLLLHLDYQWYHFNNVEALQLIQSINPELDIRSKIEALDTLRFKTATQKLAIMELRQVAGMSINLDSLKVLVDGDLEAFRQQRRYASWQRGMPYCPLEPLLIAYRILRRDGKQPRELFPYLRFILESRTATGWGNTYMTAQVLQTLIPDIGAKAIIDKPRATLRIDGLERPLPFDSAITLAAVPGSMEVIKKGYGLVFFTAYQRWFNAAPQKADSLFNINTYFYQGNAGNVKQVLKAGEPVTLRVNLEVKHDLDYVMLEIPIPAGCSYGEKTQGYSYGQGLQSYREYFRQKTVCYYRDLPAGTYVIDIALQPRYNGNYVLNCAKAEQMYMPLLSGNNEISRIKISGL